MLLGKLQGKFKKIHPGSGPGCTGSYDLISEETEMVKLYSKIISKIFFRPLFLRQNLVYLSWEIKPIGPS